MTEAQAEFDQPMKKTTSGLYVPQRQLILPKPHSREQRIIMQAFMSHNLLEIWVACGTKFGKTAGFSGGFSGRAAVKQGSLFRWIAPIYSQSKIGFKYCKKILPPEPEVDINKSEPSITIVGNDTRMEFKSGKNPEDLEGEATDCNVLDEAAKMQEQVYSSTKTTTTVTRGLIAACSTPRGKNWFYNRCMDAKSQMDWAVKRGKSPTHIFITAPSISNPAVSKEAVEEARRALPERLFRQYYLAEFMDDGDVFSGYRDCLMEMDTLDFGERESQFWLHEDHTEAQVVIGADWAKTKDRTVFYAIDLVTRRCMGFQRFYKTKYTEAIRKLVLFSKKFNDVVVVLHDKTGLGTVIDDYLGQTDLPYEGVTLGNANKGDMIAKLITGFEEVDHYIPDWPYLMEELESFEVKTTLAGNMSYGAADGKHDDVIIAMMLAYMGLLQYGDRELEVSYTDGPVKKPTAKTGKLEGEPEESALSRFYQDIAEDDEDD